MHRSQLRVIVERVYEATQDIVDLIGELEKTLAASYPPEQRHGIPVEHLFEPHVRFYVANRDGAAVGCGAVAQYGDYAEVKRMFTKPAARGHGVARGASRPDRKRRARSGTHDVAGSRPGIFSLRRSGFSTRPTASAVATHSAHIRYMPAATRLRQSLFYEKAL